MNTIFYLISLTLITATALYLYRLALDYQTLLKTKSSSDEENSLLHLYSLYGSFGKLKQDVIIYAIQDYHNRCNNYKLFLEHYQIDCQELLRRLNESPIKNLEKGFIFFTLQPLSNLTVTKGVLEINHMRVNYGLNGPMLSITGWIDLFKDMDKNLKRMHRDCKLKEQSMVAAYKMFSDLDKANPNQEVIDQIKKLLR